MATIALTAVLAAVLGLQGELVRLDKGLVDGFRTGDRGRVFYTLTVGQRKVRIDAGQAEIVEVDDLHSLARSLDDSPIRPGYLVEVDIAPDRTTPTAFLELATERFRQRDYPAALVYFEKVRELLPGDPLAVRKIAETKALLEGAAWRQQERQRLDFYRLAAQSSFEEGDLRSAESYVEKILRVDASDEAGRELHRKIARLRLAASMILVPARQYEIGASLPQAKFYNQQPRHRVRLEAYWIDRRPVTNQEFRVAVGGGPEEAVAGVSFDEALAYCRSVGKRLPTEFEWEAASTRNGFQSFPQVSEWTHSWYKPYPGNRNPEREYGEKFRVVKGFAEDGQFDPRLRFFMAPSDRARDVGFRCAMDAAG